MKKSLLAGCLSMFLACTFCAAAETVLDDDFSTNAPDSGVPAGWKMYQQGPETGDVTVRREGNVNVLYFNDVCGKSEIGITRDLSAVSGKYYRLTAEIGDLSGVDLKKSAPALQLRFMKRPQNSVYNVWVSPGKTAVATGQADADALRIYLFTMRSGRAKMTVKRIKLEVSDKPF